MVIVEMVLFGVWSSLGCGAKISDMVVLFIFLGISGVESFDVDLKEQKVTVKGNVQPEAVLQTVSKTGKKTSFWEAEAETGTKEAEAETGAKEPVVAA